MLLLMTKAVAAVLMSFGLGDIQSVFVASASLEGVRTKVWPNNHAVTVTLRDRL